MTELILKDYDNKETHTGIDLDDKNIATIMIEIISGDEIAHIIYKDGSWQKIDSCEDGRTLNFFDDEYILYSENDTEEENGKRRKKFLNRQDSYGYIG